MTDYMHRPANEIKPGDILPEISRSTVSRVIIFPNENVRGQFADTDRPRFFPYGGPDYGWPTVSIERGI